MIEQIEQKFTNTSEIIFHKSTQINSNYEVAIFQGDKWIYQADDNKIGIATTNEKNIDTDLNKKIDYQEIDTVIIPSIKINIAEQLASVETVNHYIEQMIWPPTKAILKISDGKCVSCDYNLVHELDKMYYHFVYRLYTLAKA